MQWEAGNNRNPTPGGGSSIVRAAVPAACWTWKPVQTPLKWTSANQSEPGHVEYLPAEDLRVLYGIQLSLPAPPGGL